MPVACNRSSMRSLQEGLTSLPGDFFYRFFVMHITRGAPGGGEAPNKRGWGPAMKCVALNKQ